MRQHYDYFMCFIQARKTKTLFDVVKFMLELCWVVVDQILFFFSLFFFNVTNCGHQVVNVVNCKLEVDCISSNWTWIVFMIDYHTAECLSHKAFDANDGFNQYGLL